MLYFLGSFGKQELNEKEIEDSNSLMIISQHLGQIQNVKQGLVSVGEAVKKLGEAFEHVATRRLYGLENNHEQSNYLEQSESAQRILIELNKNIAEYLEAEIGISSESYKRLKASGKLSTEKKGKSIKSEL